LGEKKIWFVKNQFQLINLKVGYKKWVAIQNVTKNASLAKSKKQDAFTTSRKNLTAKMYPVTLLNAFRVAVLVS
jgi:hypothetical protein